MNININNEKYKYVIDRNITLEIVGALFNINFNSNNGITHMLLDDLIKYLFYIDMSSLVSDYCLITGLTYYFNCEGYLKSFVLLNEILNNPNIRDKFTIQENIFGRSIVKVNEYSNIVEYDYLSNHRQLLVYDVYNKAACFTDSLFNELFNTDNSSKRNCRNRFTYITLDYLIDRLSLNKEAIIENLFLHNARVS